MVSPGSSAPSGRGANTGRRLVATGVLCLALLVLIVALIYPTVRRQGQYAALRAHGVTTTARIAYCSNSVSIRPNCPVSGPRYKIDPSSRTNCSR